MDISEGAHLDGQQIANLTDLTFALSRFPHQHGCLLPSWTAYNAALSALPIPVETKIFYLPVIDASPTDNSTVYTILLKSVQIADVIQQESIVLVVDQAIYCKLQQIRWKDPNLMKRTVIRLGEFHTAMAFLACIGKRFGDAGFQEVLLEAGVVAHGSLNGVISGHHYNRSLRAHKLFCEALEHLRWQSFVKTLPDDERTAASNLLLQLQLSFPTDAHSRLTSGDGWAHLMGEYVAFIQSHLHLPTFAFWSSYIDMVRLALAFIRATREANWNLHLSTVRSFIPWFFAYDHTNYSRYLPAYWLEMQQLSKSHPGVHAAFMDGEFAVQRQRDHGFSGVAADQTIEQTVNRDTKMKGGVVGSTTSKGYFHRWILSQHLRAEIQQECEEMAGKGRIPRKLKELDTPRMKRDNADVQAICDTLQTMVNPFEETNASLVHLSSGLVATAEVSERMLNAKTLGDTAADTFFKERLQDGSEDIHNPIRRQKLPSFSTLLKNPRSGAKHERASAVQQDRNLFARLLVVSKYREFDMRDILSHSLNSVPLPLANDSGGINKTNKASLMRHLESTTVSSSLVQSIPKHSTWIVDGMALIQELNQKMIAPMTFGELAAYILKRLVSMATTLDSDAVHFVTDCYPPVSIKNAERGKRAMTGVQKIKIFGPQQPVPTQWKKFLSDGANKEALVNFLHESWCRTSPDHLKNVTVYLAHSKECHSFKATGGKLEVNIVPQLASNHEEADTRLLLHCQFASEAMGSEGEKPNLLIRSPDTDVFVIAVGLCDVINGNVLFHTGRGDHLRTIDVQAVRNGIGTSVADALIGLHCFTGCDSVSSFYGKGKVKALKLVSAEGDYQTAFKQLGGSFEVSPELCAELEKFVCALYGQHVDSVDTARYNMFMMDCKSETMMPPNKDSLHQHILRANYQAAIHRRALEQLPEVPQPTEHGWTLVDGELLIKWGELPPAPQGLMTTTQCGCKKGKCLNKQCDCVKNSVKCTDLCKCLRCENKNLEELDIPDEDHDVLDSDEE